MHIGIAMRRMRKEAYIQQKVMARKIGISTQALLAIETGASIPKSKTVDKFCEAMGICRAKLILMSLGPEDMPDDAAARDDVLDIIALATLRLSRYEARKTMLQTIFSGSELEEQTKKLQEYGRG